MSNPRGLGWGGGEGFCGVSMEGMFVKINRGGAGFFHMDTWKKTISVRIDITHICLCICTG